MTWTTTESPSFLILEVVLHQLLEHFGMYHLLSSSSQHHPTKTALVQVTNYLLSDCDNSYISILSMLDLLAAFDTLDHHILLQRLCITLETVLGWLYSCLLIPSLLVSTALHQNLLWCNMECLRVQSLGLSCLLPIFSHMVLWFTTLACTTTCMLTILSSC